MKAFKKTSDTSIRVLETLKLLAKNRASVNDVLCFFEKSDPDNKIYTSEVILKYINTLKVFGFRFIKEKDKYVLLNTPVQFDFNENDLKVMKLIEKFTELLPEEKIKVEITKFLQELEKRFSDNTRLLSHNIKKPGFINLNLDYKKYTLRIKEYEKYCQDKQRLKITYSNKAQSATSIMVEPEEIKYQGNDVFLSVYNPLSAQIQDINFNSIIKVEQLPLKSNPQNMSSSVTFKLKDRLAKNYRLHENEELIATNNDESIIILNRKEDRQLLLKRLMRYGENCELLSPKSLREEMKSLIKAALAMYRG